MEIGKIHLLNISDIRVDGGTQSRAALDQATVDEYAQAMKDGAEFPVLLAYWDGEEIWLAEGFHRHAAARKAGIQGLQTKVFGGDRRAALSHSLTANVKHGLRRTNADKRHCVVLMLRDEEWVKWSDGQIAQHCSVDPKTVSNIRKELILTMEIPESDMRKGADGRTYDTSAIGKKKPGVQPKKPDEHGCLTCGEIFDKEVWHCPTCNTHWPPSKDTCPNCYKAPTVTTTKLSAAAVADQVFGEGDEPPPEAEAIQKPAHGVLQEDLSEAFNWQAVADQYLAENLALKKDLEEAKRIIRQLEDEKAESIKYIQEKGDELISIRNQAKDLAWERDQFFNENTTLKAQNQHLTKEAEQRKLSWDKLKNDLLHAEEDIEQLTKSRDSFYGKIQELRAAMDPLYKELNRLREEAAEAVQLATDKAHWFGVAEQLREELDTVTSERDQIQSERFDLVAKVAELEAQIASFTSGTVDATRAGAHAPARALSLVPTINIHGEEREKKGSAEGNQAATPTTPKAKRQAKNVKRQLPDDFPVQELQEWAAENHPSVNFEVEFEKFKDHHQAKGNTFADWLSAGRNWIRRAEEYKQSTPGFPRSKNNGTATPRPRTSQDSYVFTPKEVI